MNQGLQNLCGVFRIMTSKIKWFWEFESIFIVFLYCAKSPNCQFGGADDLHTMEGMEQLREENKFLFFFFAFTRTMSHWLHHKLDWTNLECQKWPLCKWSAHSVLLFVQVLCQYKHEKTGWNFAVLSPWSTVMSQISHVLADMAHIIMEFSTQSYAVFSE